MNLFLEACKPKVKKVNSEDHQKICDICKQRPAKHHVPEAGVWVCDECFVKLMQQRIKRYINERRLFSGKRKYRILVALSGGKDSAMLLHALHSLYPERLELLTLHIDEGIPGYSEHMGRLALDYAKRFGSQAHYEARFVSWTGYTLPEIVQLLRAKGLRNFSPCTFCTIIKRRILDEVAKELAVDYVFTGHNLTDFVVSLLINLYSGNYQRLLRLVLRDRIETQGPYPPKHWPLLYISDKETRTYASIVGIRLDYSVCPWKMGIRKILEQMLDELRAQNPTLEFNVLSIARRLAKDLPKDLLKQKLYTCKYCGWLTSSPDRVCSYCKLMGMIGHAETKIPERKAERIF
jgi:tRNA(Ile)-lysidine synthase TilS/MesJ